MLSQQVNLPQKYQFEEDNSQIQHSTIHSTKRPLCLTVYL